MLSGNKAVLIVGYSGSTITYYDIGARSKRNVSRSNAEDDFKEIGNVFISYVK